MKKLFATDRWLPLLVVTLLTSCSTPPKSADELDKLLDGRLVVKRVTETDHLLNFEWPILVGVEVEGSSRNRLLVFLIDQPRINCRLDDRDGRSSNGVLMHTGSQRALKMADSLANAVGGLEGEQSHNVALLVDVLRGTRKVHRREWKRIRGLQ